MEENFPFPYPCEYFPSFDTHHEATTLIKTYKAQHHIKRCAHLYVATGGPGLYTETYAPGCHKNSFRVERNQSGPARAFYGCPENCALYRPAWMGREGWLKEKWWPLRRGVAGIAQWYASLNGVVQALIAVVILVVAGTPFLKAVAEILKIIYAK